MNRISRLKLALCLPAILFGFVSEAPGEVILLGVNLETTAHVAYTPNDGEPVSETVTDSSDEFTINELGNFEERSDARITFPFEDRGEATVIANGHVQSPLVVGGSLHPIVDLNANTEDVSSRMLEATTVGTLQVEVTQRPAKASLRVEAFGDIRGGGDASALVTFGVEGADPLFEFSVSGDLNNEPMIGQDEFDIDPGVYLFKVMVSGMKTEGGKGQSQFNDLRISLDSFLDVGQEEEPIKEIFWEALNGDYNQATNWEPQQVPGAGQTAIFDKNQDYTVNYGDEESGRFVVVRGHPTFTGGSYEVLGGSEESPSLVVGATAVDNATLTLANHQLESLFSTIGNEPGANGSVVVENGSDWTEQGRMVIGNEGIGSLTINDGAIVTSSETRINQGSVTVSNELPQKGIDAEWETGNLVIGLESTGVLNQLGGYILSDEVYLGFDPGSTGFATVTSEGDLAQWEFGRVLSIGTQGEGRMAIVNGAEVLSESGEADNAHIDLGVVIGSEGYLDIKDLGSTLMAPGLAVSIAQDGTGEVTVRNGAMVDCRQVDVGGVGGGNGTVIISDSTWRCNEIFRVGEFNNADGGSGKVALSNGTLDVILLNVFINGTIEGVGQIIADIVGIINGTVAPGVPIDPFKTAPKQDVPIGTLTFRGNVEMVGALIEIGIGGLAEGEYDVIHATGSVDIQGATVRFVFVDGFLPQMGDQVAFLIADGTTSVANLTTIIEGVAEGFELQVKEENGMILFEALNDAQPEGEEPTPLPTALNPDADVNGDKVIDADDLIEVLENLKRTVSQ